MSDARRYFDHEAQDIQPPRYVGVPVLNWLEIEGELERPCYLNAVDGGVIILGKAVRHRGEHLDNELNWQFVSLTAGFEDSPIGLSWEEVAQWGQDSLESHLIQMGVIAYKDQADD